MLQLFHVQKQYRGEAPALADISLSVKKGEFVFLTGPSGAGKSTLLRLVFCAEAATSGQLIVLGRNVAKLKPPQIAALRRSIGVVFQDFKLLPGRTVAENVAFPLGVRGLSQRAVRRGVGRGLAGDPALLLADEPTGNLDPDRTVEVMELLHAANARGTAVLVATHDRGLLERYRKRVVALERGRVVSDGNAIPSPGAA